MKTNLQDYTFAVDTVCMECDFGGVQDNCDSCFVNRTVKRVMEDLQKSCTPMLETFASDLRKIIKEMPDEIYCTESMENVLQAMYNLDSALEDMGV